MGLLTRSELLNSGALVFERAMQAHIMWKHCLQAIALLVFHYNHHGKRLLTSIGGSEWNKDLKCLLGQVGKLRSVTTPKLNASWNIHEQSFLVGRVLEINQEISASC